MQLIAFISVLMIIIWFNMSVVMLQIHAEILVFMVYHWLLEVIVCVLSAVAIIIDLHNSIEFKTGLLNFKSEQFLHSLLFNLTDSLW
jgi:hypothetical protein